MLFKLFFSDQAKHRTSCKSEPLISFFFKKKNSKMEALSRLFDLYTEEELFF